MHEWEKGVRWQRSHSLEVADLVDQGLGFARIANTLCDSNVKPGTTNCIAVVIQYSAPV